jgi:hypothetical protein
MTGFILTLAKYKSKGLAAKRPLSKHGTGEQTMYDELVKRLREVADEVDNDYDVDPYNAEQRCLAILQAADAIDELSSQLDDFKRLCLPLKENRLYKYSDGSFVEVFLILPSEPPKEG